MDVLAGEVSLTSLLASIVVAFALVLSLFYLGFYGGADAKALLFIAATVSAYPEGFKPVHGYVLSTRS